MVMLDLVSDWEGGLCWGKVVYGLWWVNAALALALRCGGFRM